MNERMYAIVDIETTGGSPKTEKITEIAIYIHDGEQITNEFITLINPEKNIPHFITNLTGITNEMVANAPKFYEVAKKVVELTQNKIFVAHNVSFDFNFIKNEFKQLGYDFQRDRLCTVKLSRKLLPGHRSYSLGNLCDDLNISNESRHRASGDAMATVKLLEYLLRHKESNKMIIEEVTKLSLKGLNPLLDIAKVKNLPEEPGVYYLHNENKDVIYVGKSKNLKKRVVSHLNNANSKRAIEIKERTADISYECTGNELIALLLESAEIKRLKPLFNRAQRRTMCNYGLYHSYNEHGYLCFQIEKNSDNDQVPLITYNLLREAKEHLYDLVEKHQLCLKLCGLYKSKGACFNYEILQCNGACINKEDKEVYNQRAQEIFQSISYQHNNFLIIDKGRNGFEKSIVKIQNGKYIGFGFFDADQMIDNIEVIDDCIKHYEDNRDVQYIINKYMKKHQVEKILKFA